MSAKTNMAWLGYHAARCSFGFSWELASAADILAGLQKLEDYYSHTADSDVYTFAMCASFHNLLNHLTVHLIQHRKRHISTSTGAMTNWKKFSRMLKKQYVYILAALLHQCVHMLNLLFV